MILISLGCAWIAGIILGSIFDISPFLILTGLIPVLLIPVFRHYWKSFILTGLCLIAFFSGAWYFRAELPANDAGNLSFYNDRGAVEIQGLISRDPEQKKKSAQLYLTAESLKRDGAWGSISGTALVFVPLYSGYEYGDSIRIKGEPKTPPRLDDFDYEHYLATKGIYSTFTFPNIEVIEKGLGSQPLRWIFSLRNNLSDIITTILPEPQASFTEGVLLGIKSGIPEPVKEEFRATGMSHILAISGLHLSIIAGICITLGVLIFGRKGYTYVWLALIMVWLYAVLTGLYPPVTRAALMVSLFLFAELFGRQRSAVISLIVAAVIMTGFTPGIIRDASFQMSFAAMAGLVFIFPPVRHFFRRIIQTRFGESGAIVALLGAITDCLSVSIGAVTAVWPLIAFYFGAISPVSPITTLIVLPFLPIVIISGIACGITGLISLPVAQVIGWINWLFSSAILWIVKLFSFIPPVEMVLLNSIPVITYYIFLAIFIWFAHRKLNKSEPLIIEANIISPIRKEWIITTLSILALFSMIVACTMPDKDLHISFLNIGQGDAILIQKGHRQILIDGGPDHAAIMHELGKKLPLWDRTIDLIVLTHPDSDHLAGLVEVLNRYEVTRVIYPDTTANTTLFQDFKQLLHDENIDNFTVCAGKRIYIEANIYLDILNPLEAYSSPDIDNDSIVLKMTAGNLNFLLTGDIMREAELRLLSSRLVSECTVLKIAHHGSSSSTMKEFLNVVKPEIAVISVGSDNRFGHPTTEVLERLQENEDILIYRTDKHGTIEFIIDGTSLRVITEKFYQYN